MNKAYKIFQFELAKREFMLSYINNSIQLALIHNDNVFKQYIQALSANDIEILCFLVLSSASVFGVSPQSMQCSIDERGNSVPTILLMMQKRLYQGGGLQVCFLAHSYS